MKENCKYERFYFQIGQPFRHMFPFKQFLRMQNNDIPQSVSRAAAANSHCIAL